MNRREEREGEEREREREEEEGSILAPIAGRGGRGGLPPDCTAVLAAALHIGRGCGIPLLRRTPLRR